MMTPYTIAHLKLSIALRKTGFKYFNETKTGKTRLRVYLTNSLEQSEAQQDLLSFGFAESIAQEAKEAGKIKRETPIMVVIGNPPYSGVSSNETEYANKLVEKYKIEPGGKQKLQERKHWLNDDYVKFIALAEGMIEKNGEGIVGFITNHGYLDNPTFRGMRWHFMDTFDSIHVIDLHGNAKKKEVSPDGSKDENIFAIQQGVSIMLAVKTGKKKKGDLAKAYHLDIWGKRKSKLDQLNNLSFENAKWTPLEPRLPNLIFVESGSMELEKEYRKGFNLKDIFTQSNIGLMTARDKLFIEYDKSVLDNRMKRAFDIERDMKFDKDYRIENSKSYKLLDKLCLGSFNEENIINVSYRPFDTRYCYYDVNILSRPLFTIQRHLLKDNLALLVPRQLAGDDFRHVFISDTVTEMCLISNATKEANQVFPLYLYFEDGSKIQNLKKEIVAEIEKIVGKVTPEDIFDYIYAVLHSPNYREKYKEFLKINFPRVPYPKDAKTFKKLVVFGAELRSLHLLESSKVNQFITTYPIAGSNIVEKLAYKNGKVFINTEQYFGNVPEVAWNFYIGGYQPSQKWLKDRKGRALTNMDIEHYQKIIVALIETDRIMKEIKG
jgi:predicted helicase